jgi:flavorubredoxin
MATVTEIAPDVYRISVYAEWAHLQFNHFLVKDDEPLLFHTGLRGMFPQVREGLSTLIDPSKLRKIGFSHFESDECGSVHEWLALAPQAEVVCSDLGAMVTVNDFLGSPARGLADGGTFSTGKYRFRFCRTPHLPHGWDAGVLFEETQRVLLCSDLFHQSGDVEPLTESDVVGRSHQAMREYQTGILAEYVPYTHLTSENFKKLAELKPQTLAIMHGSSFSGDGARALQDLDVAFRDVFGRDEGK